MIWSKTDPNLLYFKCTFIFIFTNWTDGSQKDPEAYITVPLTLHIYPVIVGEESIFLRDHCDLILNPESLTQVFYCWAAPLCSRDVY